MDADELVRRTRAGDRQAFVELTRLYQKKVFILTYAFFRNKEDALDLVQETFLRAFERLDGFDEGRNFEAWLLQVAKNLCIDEYRKL
ncbi:MAG: sigma-70 family RNA polymerase sigma factor, partial [Candidatus Aminicenantes bacterium]|nr:sigma-70 family RNA polymerase sigma factor [Candidatus Aminicenantes bacterium]